MRHEPIFKWDPDTGTATCILTDGHNIFVGIATCSPEDQDMMNEKTGCHIAQFRAEIDYLIHIRDNELKPKLAALKQLYFSINKSSHFNEKSYETKMLRRQIYLINSDLNAVKEELTQVKEDLKFYLQEKENFYKKVRENRLKVKNN